MASPAPTYACGQWISPRKRNVPPKPKQLVRVLPFPVFSPGALPPPFVKQKLAAIAELDPFIPRDVFEAYRAFQEAGGENALMFFVRNPQHERWAPWIMTPGNYEQALARFN